MKYLMKLRPAINESAVGNDDFSISYDSDQSCDSNPRSNSLEEEEHWDSDMEEVLKDLETDYELEPSVTGGSVNTILLLYLFGQHFMECPEQL